MNAWVSRWFVKDQYEIYYHKFITNPCYEAIKKYNLVRLLFRYKQEQLISLVERKRENTYLTYQSYL